jgi:hypothetical protein
MTMDDMKKSRLGEFWKALTHRHDYTELNVWTPNYIANRWAFTLQCKCGVVRLIEAQEIDNVPQIPSGEE